MRKKPKNKTKQKHNRQISVVLILVCLAAMVVFILSSKTPDPETTLTTNESAEVMFDRLMEEGTPTFVFFHSTNCKQCILMMDTVAKVYPEFEGSVALVDVNVYDSINQNLLGRAQIQVIPTQMFIDASGQSTVKLGVMTSEELRQYLWTLAGSNK